MSDKEKEMDSAETEFDEDTEPSGNLSEHKRHAHTQMPSGSKLGRYILLELIGEGGMGAVYKAFDPALDRRIAIKILNIESVPNPQKARKRLIREAQALAHLSHPNVVAAYDVGIIDDAVFVAMEYVEGQTLRHWLRDEPRTQEEILDVFVEAGCGLKAAHEAGMIHRDFKPANVIVGEDGRVRVLDFGLARVFTPSDDSLSGDEPVPVGLTRDTADESEPETIPLGNEPLDQPRQERLEHPSQQTPEGTTGSDLSLDDISQSKKLLTSDLTLIGEVVGTPPYMAPEQFLNLEVGDYTDQFSYCVALYEALYGKRPFSGNRLDLLREDIYSEKISEPPDDKKVPQWLHALIIKGLSPRPQDRYASMGELLEVLKNDPQKARMQRRAVRRRRALIAVLALLSVLGPLTYWYFQRVRTLAACKDVTGELRGVWDESTRKSLQQSFAKTGLAYAADTASRVSQNLDKYVQNWTRLRGEVCESKWSAGTESDLSFHMKMNCFDLRLRELGSLVRAFTAADSDLIPKAVQASLSLSRLKTCTDDVALRQAIPLPEDADTRAKVKAIRLQVADLKTLLATGKLDEGEKLARELEKKAEALSYLPLQAETSFILGDFLSRIRKAKEAEKVLYKAANIAARSKYTQWAMRSFVTLVFVVGYQQQRSKDGLVIARDAEILVKLAGGDKTEQASLLSKQALVLSLLGRYQEAKDNLKQAIAIDEDTFGPEHPTLARDIGNLALLLMDLGEYELARDYLKETLAIFKKSLGAKHPYVAYTFGNLGLVEYGRTNYELSEEYHEKALNLLKELYGTNHRDVAWCLTNLANLHLDMGEFAQARQENEQSRKILNKISGTKGDIAESLETLGRLEMEQGDFKKAKQDLQKALRFTEEVHGPEHIFVASVLEDLGELYVKTAQYSNAKKVLDRALSIRKKTKGQQERALVTSLFLLGKMYAAQGKALKAKQQFERVLSICADTRCEPGALHGSEFGLAKILKSSGDKARAEKLARQALEAFSKRPKRFNKQVLQIKKWMESSL